MPATYAHYKFGEAVKGSFPEDKKEIRDIIDRNVDLFSFGLHGPDIFFYYHPLIPNDVKIIGNMMHEDIGWNFFHESAILINAESDSIRREKMFAYIAGFICHFMLDTKCHGYIADKMKEYLKSKKVTSGIINLGGNVLTIGSKSDGSDYTVGIQKPFGGSVQLGDYLEIGYFEQESSKDNYNTALDDVWAEYPVLTNYEVRQALAKCGLSNEHITSQVRVLSGGEAAKVRLCKLMLKDINFLVLDEPTNHLDVEAKDELKKAIKEFKGTVLLVCHEPEFYNDIVDDVWNIEDFTTKIV